MKDRCIFRIGFIGEGFLITDWVIPLKRQKTMLELVQSTPYIVNLTRLALSGTFLGIHTGISISGGDEQRDRLLVALIVAEKVAELLTT